ncbi:hypothetical protein Zmor_016460 [Zophobas morio]|uniref:hydroxyacylglutathione hydrolase n=1 Tax=Zophobas morio TaxID=2755281 RepID=A0AA38HJ86_9CUCU|nr:hypothetical protein Zmor_016460 [Zophobas morio]
MYTSWYRWGTGGDTLLAMFQVVPVPVLEDNYAYLVIDESTKETAVVDCVEPTKVIKEVKKRSAKICMILTTHSHFDHAGGNKEMLTLLNNDNIPVYGGFNDFVDSVTREVKQDDQIDLGSDTLIKVLYTPCHTQGHVCYHVSSCGNFNSGTPEQMYEALYHKLGKLPEATEVYVGHEYTVKNIRFAFTVDPNNVVLKDKFKWAVSQRERGLPTVPSTIGCEKKTNPFMRVNEKAIREAAGQTDPIKVNVQLNFS